MGGASSETHRPKIRSETQRPRVSPETQKPLRNLTLLNDHLVGFIKL